MALPKGIITGWYDTIANIPSGWVLCDGNNDTPDLSDLFVMGAASDADVGLPGGEASHTHACPGLDSAGAHNHGVGGNTNTVSGTGGETNSSGSYAATQGSHSHSFSTTTNTEPAHTHNVGASGSNSVIPPYVYVFFIMKT